MLDLRFGKQEGFEWFAGVGDFCVFADSKFIRFNYGGFGFYFVFKDDANFEAIIPIDFVDNVLFFPTDIGRVKFNFANGLSFEGRLFSLSIIKN
jgi:hypothetical protein